MDPRFLIGIIGSLLLVIGSALPDRSVSHPAKSRKNQFFAIGNACMFAYALLGYLAGGPIFFVVLQIFIVLSTLLMMLGTPDRFSTPLLSIAGFGLVGWVLALFEGYGTAIFVIGLVLLGIGFALNAKAAKRAIFLSVGSAAIALFSLASRDWVFFVLNVFFTLFSGWHAARLFLPAQPHVAPETRPAA